MRGDLDTFRKSVREDLARGATHWAHGELLRTEAEILKAWRDGHEIEVKPKPSQLAPRSRGPWTPFEDEGGD